MTSLLDKKEDFVHGQISDLVDECLQLAKVAQVKAEIYKAISTIFTVLIIISGVVVSILGMVKDSDFFVYISILGAIISTIKTTTSVFKLETNAQLFKSVQVELTTMSKKVALLNYSEADINFIAKELEVYQVKVNQINMRMFSYDRPNGDSDAGTSSTGSNNSTIKGLKRYNTMYSKMTKYMKGDPNVVDVNIVKATPSRNELEAMEGYHV